MAPYGRGDGNAESSLVTQNKKEGTVMCLVLNKPSSRLVLFFLVLNLITFSAFGQSKRNHSASPQAQVGQTADVSDVAKNPQQYMGKEVTVEWKVDRVYSPNAIGLEKDEKHLLVIGVTPGALGDTSAMKRGDPFMATGVVSNFDRAGLERQYGTIDFGKSSLHKFENKPVVVVGARQAARLEPPQTPPVEREKPSSVTKSTPQTEQAPQAAAPPEQKNESTALPRTASPVPLIGFIGFLALLAGLGVPLLRRQ
jgi:hypothetical protein